MTTKFPISFYSADTNFTPKHKKKLKVWVFALCEQERVCFQQLTYVFCSEAYLLHLNQTYLNHDTHTDIITFDLSETTDLNSIIGEIYISYERVAENAKNFGVSKEEELLRVLAHGILHLIGYKDKKPNEIKTMRQKEHDAINLFYKTQ